MIPPRWTLLLLLILVLAATVPPLAGQTAAAPALSPASPENVLRHVTVLAGQIGPRPSGAPGYTQASEYMEAQLRGFGYEVERQRFPFTYFEARTARVRLLPEGETIQPTIPLYTPPTPPQGLEAPLAAAGLGRPDDLRRADLRGRIALMERGELTFRQKTENAADAGAVAAIIYNNQPGPVPQVTLLSRTRIPAVLVRQEEGQRLQALLGRGQVRVHVLVDVIFEERTTWNVVGRRAGRSAKILVIGGHLDTVPQSPGANDNGSGIAAGLEAARLLAGQTLPFTVEVIGFGGEEIALLGSVHYVGQKGGGVAGMVNMDMVGRGSLSVGNAGGDPRLVTLAARLAGGLGLNVGRFRFGASDHVPFERAGLPTVFIHTGDDPLIHTPQDVIDRLDPQRMAQAAQLAAMIALEADEVLR